jgi:hypothetical protein
MNKYVSTVVKHWKSTVTGLLVGVITLMYYLEKIDTQEWIIAIGGIATIAAMFSKDPDKTASKSDL